MLKCFYGIMLLIFHIKRITISVTFFHIANLVSSKHQENCLGGPYLYITVHDEIKNILVYSRNGCLLSNNLLDPSGLDKDSQLRSMVIGEFFGKTALFLADASQVTSKIIMYLLCAGGRRWCYHDVIASRLTNPGADHTYGLTFDSDNNLLASFQHTNVVLRFERNVYREMDLTPVLQNDRYVDSFFPGTFLQFGKPDIPNKDDGVRAILYVRGNIWIANTHLDSVVVADSWAGETQALVSVRSPIGLYYSKDHDVVFVSSKSKKFGGAVYVVNPSKLKIHADFPVFRTNKMKHPTGITHFENTLFVADQTSQCVHAFHIKTGEHLGKVIRNVPGVIEQIILSDVFDDSAGARNEDDYFNIRRDDDASFPGDGGYSGFDGGDADVDDT